MTEREKQAERNLSRAFLRFPYLSRYERRTHNAHEPHDLHDACGMHDARGGRFPHMRPSDVMMLFTIENERKKGNGVTATRLSESMGIKAPSVNAVLSSLERMELIRRVTDESDRRFVLITLSAKGEAMLEHFRAGYEAKIQELVAYLGAEKSNQLAELMNEIYEYLRAKGGRPPERTRK